jgi:hypothetical protein
MAYTKGREDMAQGKPVGVHMSMLILERQEVRLDGSYYMIRKMNERFRASDRGNRQDWGTFNDWSIHSKSNPQIESSPIKKLWLHGTNRDLDCRTMWVPAPYRGSLERAVLEFNIQYGNNKCLDIEDVIWEKQ